MNYRPKDENNNDIPDIAEQTVDNVPEESREYVDSLTDGEEEKGFFKKAVEKGRDTLAGNTKVGKAVGFGLDVATFLAPHGSKIDTLRQKGKQALNLNEQKFNFKSNNNDMNWIGNRLKEKSTWRGIVAVLTAVGVGLSPDQKEAIITLGIALIGAFEAFFKEPQSKDAKVN